MTLVWLFAFYAILAGVSQIGLGFRLRGLGQAANADGGRFAVALTARAM